MRELEDAFGVVVGAYKARTLNWVHNANTIPRAPHAKSTNPGANSACTARTVRDDERNAYWWSARKKT
jgi:hypothetical protein